MIPASWRAPRPWPRSSCSTSFQRGHAPSLAGCSACRGASMAGSSIYHTPTPLNPASWSRTAALMMQDAAWSSSEGQQNMGLACTTPS